jgi:hypothetical protein
MHNDKHLQNLEGKDIRRRYIMKRNIELYNNSWILQYIIINKGQNSQAKVIKKTETDARQTQ